MAQSSTIEWTEATWNPVVGCRKVSSGCANCYAERMAKRLAAMAEADSASGRNPGKKAAYLRVINRCGRWNGDVYLDYSSIEAPLSWTAPRVIFVNSMSDLFHEDVPEDFIQAVFDVMNRCDHHTFQVLTKRPERARELSRRLTWGDNIWMGTSAENKAVTDRVRHFRGKARMGEFYQRYRQLWSESLTGWARGRLGTETIWEKRGHDFIVGRGETLIEKLQYCHMNPVKRGLVKDPARWPWSSFRYYELDDARPLAMNWDGQWPIVW